MSYTQFARQRTTRRQARRYDADLHDRSGDEADQPESRSARRDGDQTTTSCRSAARLRFLVRGTEPERICSNSGTPFTSRQHDRPERERQLHRRPAGRRPTAARPPTSTRSSSNAGGLVGARGPDFSLASVRRVRSLPGNGNKRIMARGRVQRHQPRQLQQPTGDRRTPRCLILRSIAIAASRTAQFNVGRLLAVLH